MFNDLSASFCRGINFIACQADDQVIRLLEWDERGQIEDTAEYTFNGHSVADKMGMC